MAEAPTLLRTRASRSEPRARAPEDDAMTHHHATLFWSGPPKKPRETVRQRRFRFRLHSCMQRAFRQVVSITGPRATHRRASVRGTQRVRAYTTPQVRLARRRASCPFPSSRARRRAQSRARAARALAGARAAPKFPVFTLALFGARARVSLASAARSSDTLAARRRRGALSESHARAGLTARRARRPGGGARGLLL